MTQTAETAIELHVSTIGNDGNDGSPEAPFATLTAARDALRKVRREGSTPAGADIVVHGGCYHLGSGIQLSQQDSGSPDKPTVFRTAPGENVVLSGGIELSPADFTAVTNAEVLSRLPEESREHVLQFDLQRVGITDLGAFSDQYRGVPEVPELFFNNQRMTVACWPNEDWATIANIVDPGTKPGSGEAPRPGTFEYDGDRPSRWNLQSGVWLLGYWCFDWYEEVIKVGAIDPDKRQITLAKPHMYTVRQGNPSPRRYRAINLLEELDVPGEYFIDRNTKMLYFWPPEEMDGARITLSTLHEPLVTLKGCEHVVLRGFTLEDGLKYGISISEGTAVAIEACTIRNVREKGIQIEGGTEHRVEACDIYDTGTGGIAAQGGDRKTLTPGNHILVNNHIHHYSRHQLTYASGIHMSGVGIRATNNLIHDAPHMAVGVSGNDHVFEKNIVHHVCTETDDCGALYKGRNPSCTNNLIQHNFWHNIGSPMGHGNAAIYFDDGDVGDRVIGNVFFRCGEPGKGSFGTVFCHGGHDHTVEGNLFIECRRAIGSAPWNDSRWKNYIDADLWQERLLKEVDITRPPYTTRYPWLVGFMDPKPGEPRVSRASRNAFIMCGEVSSGNWQWSPDENIVSDTDPGFRDSSSGDFRLNAPPENGETLAAIARIPFAEMGLLESALRPNPVCENWTYPPPKPLDPPVKRATGRAVVREGPIPTYTVHHTENPPKVTDAELLREWLTDTPLEGLDLAVDISGTRLHNPGEALFCLHNYTLFAVVATMIHSDAPLIGNHWGQSDAVEISLRSLRKGSTSPIYVIRGYGNGRLEFGATPNGDTEPATMEPASLKFKAFRSQPDCWLAAFTIPLEMVDLAPGNERAACSIAVHRAHDSAWILWVPTGGHSYDADRGGILEW